MPNRNVYKRKRIVKIYSKQTHLQKPEETILDILETDLWEMKMLDIGVGGGRTTLHFAKKVKEYVGIDYSEEMIGICQQRFSDYPETVSFKVCDARNLEQFNDKSIDFVLFSFNGVDYISHGERLRLLTEIRRILKPEGYFCFSSHNLQSIHKLFEFKQQLNLQTELPKKIIRWFLTRFIYNKNVNIQSLKDLPFAIFNDGAERFGLQTYYIKPADQIKQLQEHFKNTQVFLLSNGREVFEKTDMSNIEEDWLYYLSS